MSSPHRSGTAHGKGLARLRRVAPTATLLLGGLVAFGAAHVPALAPYDLASSWAFTLAFALIVWLAGLHRPLGGSSLGLGTLALPAAFVLVGAVPAALAAAAANLGIELVHRRFGRGRSPEPRERRRLGRSLEAASSALASTLASGASWALAAPEAPVTLFDSRLTDATALSAATYLLVTIVYRYLAQRFYRPHARLEMLLLLRPLGVDLAGFWIGAPLAVVGTAQGGLLAALLAALLAVVAAEAFRNARLLASASLRASDLAEVSRAGQRVSAGSPELVSLADKVRVECAKLVKFRWFQLELAASTGVPGSWASGPDGALYEGQPHPERSPPALPGFHRRTNWQLLDHTLLVEGRALARLRLWCDPRSVDAEGVELLQALLPQLAASVDRSLLDRHAKLDPLTGAVVRRVVEARMEQIYQSCVETGGAMAVALCDLDHFKSINDTHGHGAGDQALVAVAQALAARIKQTDICCRWGGEEFLLLLTEADGGTGLAVAERLRREIEALALVVDGKRLSLTVSIGVAAFPDLFIASPADLVQLADAALYQAKRRGRNLCLLDMGRGRFRTPTGTVFTAPEAAQAPSPPRIFA